MRWLSILLGCLFSAQLWAVDPFQIEKIELNGLQRISEGTVFNYLPLKTGDRVTAERLREALSALYDTGFFKDIRLLRDGDTLVVELIERPSVASIEVNGNKEIETDELIDGLERIGLAEGRTFDRAIMDRVELELERQYFARGRYSIDIKSTVSEAEFNRVDLVLDIVEGEVAKIERINIIGNQVFDSDELLDLLELGLPGFFSFFSSRDQYSKQKLSADLETLRSWYMDRGYINFSVDSTQVSITPDRSGVYITINITEGEKFKISQVMIEGELIVDKAELRSLVKIEPGDTFSRKSTIEASEALTARLGNEGYAFANVNTVPDIDREKREVAITLYVDPGKRVYVRRINISGNSKTEDEVIRREIRQMEGGWLSTEKLNRSRVRLQRLSYLESVNVETPAVFGSDDQVDVEFTLAERSSGTFTAGLGYSGSQGLLLNASISLGNFLGSGEQVSVEVNTSDVNTTYSFSHVDPYYTVDGVSRGLSVFFRESDTAAADIANYTSNSWGGAVNYGIPLSEFNTLRAGVRFEKIEIRTGVFTPQSYIDFLQENTANNEFDLTKLTLGWSHDTRDRTIFADSGMLQSLSLETVLPGSGLEYYKWSSRTRWFYPMTKLFTLSLNGEVNYGDSYGDTTDLPFFEKYFAGGSRSVRGYRSSSLAPQESGVVLGGDFRVVSNVEVIFPPPFAPDSKTVRTSLFFDAGNVYASSGDFKMNDLRRSIGVSLLWLSPVGPLSFSLASPLNNRPEDRTESFQFTLGSAF